MVTIISVLENLVCRLDEVLAGSYNYQPFKSNFSETAFHVIIHSHRCTMGLNIDAAGVINTKYISRNVRQLTSVISSSALGCEDKLSV